MTSTTSQRDINHAEWKNPDNWSGIWLFRVYFGKRDSRIWVPAWFNSRFFSPATINLGHRFGFLVLSMLYLWGCVIFGVIGWTIAHKGPHP
jgi:uncharacterized membrane protein